MLKAYADELRVHEEGLRTVYQLLYRASLCGVWNDVSSVPEGLDSASANKP